MAGSLTYREYQSDHGTKYSIRVDESNARLRNSSLTERLCNVRTANWELPPKTLILRRIHCRAQFNLNLKRSFIVGNPIIISGSALRIGEEYLAAVDSQDNPLEAQLWIITGYTGEKFTPPVFYNQLDTGLTDGTGVDN